MLLGAKVDVVNCMVQNHKLKYEDTRKAEEKLEGETRSILNSEKIPYETHLVISGQDIGEGLVQYAEQHKADEIFIGIRKRSKVDKLVFGSTAQHVILNAPCPDLDHPGTLYLHKGQFARGKGKFHAVEYQDPAEMPMKNTLIFLPPDECLPIFTPVP